MKGSVKDLQSKQALPGVSISITGTSFGTSTDANGNYRLALPMNLQKRGTELTFSYVGYKTQKQKVHGNVLDVTLEADNQALEEVVVIGFSAQQKRAATGVAVTSARRKSDDAPVLTNIEETEAPTSLNFDVVTPTTIAS